VNLLEELLRLGMRRGQKCTDAEKLRALGQSRHRLDHLRYLVRAHRDQKDIADRPISVSGCRAREGGMVYVFASSGNLVALLRD